MNAAFRESIRQLNQFVGAIFIYLDLRPEYFFKLYWIIIRMGRSIIRVLLIEIKNCGEIAILWFFYLVLRLPCLIFVALAFLFFFFRFFPIGAVLICRGDPVPLR